MSAIRTRIRSGAYHDSIVLMALQRSLQDLPDVTDAGAVMATETNLDILRERDLLPDDELDIAPEDLLIAIRADTEDAAENALDRVDEILARRRGGYEGDYRPKTLETAVKTLPGANWVLVSVPGRHAAQVTEQALDLDRHVFLYSDNVPVDHEVRLKERAGEKGLLVLGPDCGTTLVGGFGLGFANRVRRGPVGIVAASGTGLQAVAVGLDERGVGVSHALGTGGRDLSKEVGGRTALQALDLLGRDEATEILVLVSKPPDPEVAARLLAAARATGKPTVVCFLGLPPPARRLGHLAFASDLDDAAELAARIVQEGTPTWPSPDPLEVDGYLRGLFSGGTLAAEAVRALAPFLAPLASNLSAPGVTHLNDPLKSQGHTILDLGDDALTVSRLHPMMDPDLLIERLHREAADPEVSVILLDVALGDGTHAEPAGRIASALAEIHAQRSSPLEVVAVVVGTREDPQDREAQIETLNAAGVWTLPTVALAASHVLDRQSPPSPFEGTPVSLDALTPRGAISVGVETFADSLRAQGADVVSVDWRPPASGDAQLAGILRKIKSKT